jgi:diaminopimelate decarboxylase
VLVPGAQLPGQQPGDLIAMPVTGAYCYSLLSNYNGARRPPVVFCAGGVATERVRRETYADLLARDVTDPEPIGLAPEPSPRVKESTR